jgi:hypothetical protein
MTHFKPFEVEALRLLVAPVLGIEITDDIVKNAELVGYEYSGCGYFLTVKHGSIPAKRIVCHEPLVLCRSGEVQGGYIVFLEGGELMLECHPAGAVEVSEGFRDLPVTITQPAKSLERTREE